MKRTDYTGIFINLLLMSGIILTFASCRETFFINDGQTWGTTYHIVYESARNLEDSVRAEMQGVDASLSKYNAASEVSLVNSGESDRVGEMFAEVFDISLRVNRLSGGLYDPTVGPVCELWGFGRKDFDSIPGDEAIASALATVGISDCSIAGGRIRKKAAGTEFDFSSVAKGYGIERIARMLRRNGVENYMVEIGGEIAAAGHSPKGKAWRIQLDAPFAASDPGNLHTRLEILELGPEATAVATSGNYRNYRQHSGRTFGHTISPLSGRPVESELLSATVIADDCGLADALATACMACPTVGEAEAIINQTDAGAILVSVGADSSLVINKIGCLTTAESLKP